MMSQNFSISQIKYLAVPNSNIFYSEVKKVKVNLT